MLNLTKAHVLSLRILDGVGQRHGGADGWSNLHATGKLFVVELEGAKVHAILGVIHCDHLEQPGVKSISRLVYERE